MLIFIMIIGCKQKNSSFDPEIEKAAIRKIIDQNLALLQNNDKQGLIAFLRKYDMPQSYLLTGDTLMYIDKASISDEELGKRFYQGYASVSDEFPPIIKFSQDGRMAYVIYKIHLKWKKDTIEKERKIAYFTKFNKVDSLWKSGDSMAARETADILASSTKGK